MPPEQEFHWSRAAISFAVGINILLYGVIGPFAAALMDRFGLRRTMLVLAVAAGVALTPLMREPWQFVLLWGVVVGPAPASPAPFSARLSPPAGSARQGWCSES